MRGTLCAEPGALAWTADETLRRNRALSDHTIRGALPGVFLGDAMTAEMVTAFDASLSTVVSTIDNFATYLDPSLTPDDFVGWIAQWVGISINERWPITRQRNMVHEAAELFRWRGTIRGVRWAVRLYTDAEPEVTDTGGTTWSARPGGEVPGEAVPGLVVRVTTTDSEVDADVVDRIVRETKPVHIPHEVEVRISD